MNKKIIRSVFVVLMLFCTVFSAIADDAEPESCSKIIEEYEEDVKEYYEKYQELESKLYSAFEERDYSLVKQTKRELRHLDYPVLDKEKSDMILAKVIADNDVELANWLYQNSRWYKPQVSFSYNTGDFSSSSSVSVNPGSDITIPSFKVPDRSKVLLGWGTSSDEVLYKAGEVIKMPFEDLSLKAVVAENPDLIKGRSVSVSYSLPELSYNKVEDLRIKVENNGTEKLSGLKYQLTSDDPLLVILNGESFGRGLLPGDKSGCSFKAVTKAASGTALKALLTVSDRDGELLQQNIMLTAK